MEEFFEHSKQFYAQEESVVVSDSTNEDEIKQGLQISLQNQILKRSEILYGEKSKNSTNCGTENEFLL